MPLKVVTVSLGDIPRPRAAQNTHTSHSSECILGFHSLILRHMQTHICIPSHECTHKNKMTDAEVPIKRKYSAWSSPVPTRSDGKKKISASFEASHWAFSLTLHFVKNYFTIRWKLHPEFVILCGLWGLASESLARACYGGLSSGCRS